MITWASVPAPFGCSGSSRPAPDARPQHLDPEGSQPAGDQLPVDLQGRRATSCIAQVHAAVLGLFSPRGPCGRSWRRPRSLITVRRAPRTARRVARPKSSAPGARIAGVGMASWRRSPPRTAERAFGAGGHRRRSVISIGPGPVFSLTPSADRRLPAPPARRCRHRHVRDRVGGGRRAGARSSGSIGLASYRSAMSPPASFLLGGPEEAGERGDGTLGAALEVASASLAAIGDALGHVAEAWSAVGGRQIAALISVVLRSSSQRSPWSGCATFRSIDRAACSCAHTQLPRPTRVPHRAVVRA